MKMTTRRNVRDFSQTPFTQLVLFSADEKDEEEPNAQDPYFKIANWTNEHDDFKQAELRMDDKHRKKVDKVGLE